MSSTYAHHRRTVLSALIALGALTAVACALPSATDRTKRLLSRHGTIDAEWDIRDEANGQTHTYVLLRTESGVHETYALLATDGKREVLREQAGGIDSTGCFLLPHAMTTPWIQQLPPEALEESSVSGDKTRTMCLEYKDKQAWRFIPEKARKAAEPPPPPPPAPATTPDAGTPDAGAAPEKPGEVKSALPM